VAGNSPLRKLSRYRMCNERILRMVQRLTEYLRGMTEYLRGIALWRDRISAWDCPQFPNGLAQFLMFLDGYCVVPLADICVVFVCELVLTCKKRNEKRVKIEKYSYQSFLSTDSSPKRPSPKSPSPKRRRQNGVADIYHSGSTCLQHSKTISQGSVECNEPVSRMLPC